MFGRRLIVCLCVVLECFTISAESEESWDIHRQPSLLQSLNVQLFSNLPSPTDVNTNDDTDQEGSLDLIVRKRKRDIRYSDAMAPVDEDYDMELAEINVFRPVFRYRHAYAQQVKNAQRPRYGRTMDDKRAFPTRSSYQGCWAHNTMEGFGTYTFPDGSEYRGYFKDGLFQGYGTLKFAPPHRITVGVHFEKGICTYVDSMAFADGLLFHGSYQEDGTFDSERWGYCNGADRRYAKEVRGGLEPVGPNSYLTHEKPVRYLPDGTYDTEEGTYYPHTGFVAITDYTSTRTKLRFVGCPQERNWIRENCRHKPKAPILTEKGQPVPVEPDDKFSHRIIACNLEAENQLDGDSCACVKEADRKRCFGDLCIAEDSSTDEQESDGRSGLPLTPSSSSDDSFEVFDTEITKPQVWPPKTVLLGEPTYKLNTEE